MPRYFPYRSTGGPLRQRSTSDHLHRRIHPSPYQPRKIFSEESLEELSRSIRQYGLLQPVNVRKISRDYYELIAGERRLKAARLAGFTHIRAFIQNSSDQERALLALVENLQREDLHLFEEGKGIAS